jgi:hypothetical protein
MKQAEQASLDELAGRCPAKTLEHAANAPHGEQGAATRASSASRGELFILKPQLWGMGMDLEELGRRLRRWWPGSVP